MMEITKLKDFNISRQKNDVIRLVKYELASPSERFIGVSTFIDWPTIPRAGENYLEKLNYGL